MDRLWTRLQRGPHRRNPEGGFELVEVLVAMGVFAIVATFVAGSLAAGMRGALLGKRREVATQEANKVLEIARSISYDELGLVQSDPTIASDPAITEVAGSNVYQVKASPATYEPIMYAPNATGNPFNPHTTSFERGASTLTRYVYVTGHDFNSDGIPDFKRVVARVTWTDTNSTGAINEVRAQTYIHHDSFVTAPAGGVGTSGGIDTDADGDCDLNCDTDNDGVCDTGCGTGIDTDGDGDCDLNCNTDGDPDCEYNCDTDDDGDCDVNCDPPTTGLTPMTANTSSQGFSASVYSAVGTTDPPVSAVLPTDAVVVEQPVTSGETLFRAVSRVSCSGRTSYLQSGGLTYGGQPFSVSADDDSQTATPINPADDSANASDSIGEGTEIGRLLSQTSLDSSGSCHATAEDQDELTPTDDGLPYEIGSTVGAAALTLNESLTGAGLGSVMNVLEASTSDAAQSIDHTLVGSTREIAASASGELGLTRLMVIPGTMSQGLVRIEPFSYSASVRSAPGIPSQAPAVTATSFLVWIYDPLAVIPGCESRDGTYCKQNINPLDPGFQGYDLTDHSGLTDLGLTDISYTVSLNADPPAVDPIGGHPGPNGETRWSADYTGLSVSVRLSITVDLGSTTVTLVDSAVDLRLASVSSHACAGQECVA